ncbi:DUF1800 domain-containing protein [Myxococcus sp. K38C18041901]|uniref:DUF1800 domain-containing protein n=1 Tax=Myxococcus guangdongensis TaxID=2906760 RepID=UPI0020A7F267|nr:DUF1800 family protein [Myxococcus guangdongensis]MCP3060356.1 DUF1800 domain-containing protein [Myxococcus guangdongensis]
MMRRLTLSLVVCTLACVPDEGPPGPDTPLPETPDHQRQRAEPLDTPSEPNALRFLEQATFGPRLAHGVTPPPADTVEHVMAVGIRQAITEQFAAPRSTFDGLATPDLGSQFFHHAIHGQDQLRQRVAFALAQVMVVSQNGIPNIISTPESEPRVAMASYLNLLNQRAFGDFRQLMEDVTLHPAMGTYLDLANNKAFKPNGQPISPNENYARELLQLFTLGLHRLQENGEPVLVSGEKVPVYTEAQVQAFAHTLSGWTYAAPACPAIGRSNPATYAAPMMPCDVNHDSTSRELLRGVWTTPGASARRHLKEALDNIFQDPNLPPFICKQLIQHLVSSNPSPEYVQAVVDVFKDNGSGERGDLRAVIRRILQHDEARGAQPPASQLARFGHLRPPALYVTALVRGLNGTLDTQGGTQDPGSLLSDWSQTLGQHVPRPPSVFSYYPPNAPAPGGGGLLGPEFAILDTATATARANVTHDLLFRASTATKGVLVDLAILPPVSADLVQWLHRNWLHGAMSPDLQQVILNAISHPDAGDLTRRKKLAVYLTSLSPEFQIQR